MTGVSTLYLRLKEELSSYDKIVIYGGGLYGELFLKKVYDLQIYKKVVFAVTGTPQEKEILGHEVFDIADFENCSENFIVVIAVGVKLNLELKENLEKLNIVNYLELDDELRRYLLATQRDDANDNPEIMELIREIYHRLLYLETRLDKLQQTTFVESGNSEKLDKIYNVLMEKNNGQ